jgi:hypothetical protein
LEKARQRDEPKEPQKPGEPDQEFCEDHPILGTLVRVIKQATKDD